MVAEEGKGMGKDESSLSHFYEKLGSEQKKSLAAAVTEKLQGIIGGYGELSVLVEYISVMLQSSRPKETIQTELEAFLQDESGPFTTWLCQKLEKMTESGKTRRRKRDEDPGAAPKDEAARKANAFAE
ncbi:Calcium-dependent protein kinase 2, partial [Durusdinium trenchii]